MRINFNYILTTPPKLYDKKYPIFGELEKNIIYTYSGKSALSILLRYYLKAGLLKNKADEILVPQWLGYWVYMMMHKFCFPTTAFNKRVKGVIVYHQWGFPQDIDYIDAYCKERNIFYIEDCAHSFESYYKGKRVGTFGRASIFSLAKFFPCGAGGAIYTADGSIKKLVEKMWKDHDQSLATRAFSHRLKVDAHPSEENYLELERYFAIYDKVLKPEKYALAVVRQQMRENALQIRKNNYRLIRESFAHYDCHGSIFNKDVLPWAVPLFFKRKVSEKIIKALRRINIESGIYHFDVNLNMLNPDFRECLLVPCHQGINEKEIHKMVEIIKKLS